MKASLWTHSKWGSFRQWQVSVPPPKPKVMFNIGNVIIHLLFKHIIKDFVCMLHSSAWSLKVMYARCVSIVSLVMMQWNMPNCVDIIFSQADMKRLHSLFPAYNCYRYINHYVLGVSFISRFYFVLFWWKWPKGRSSHLQPRTILP